MEPSKIQEGYKQHILKSVAYLLEDPSSADVTFVSKTRWKLPGHRLILAAASPYLLSLFTSDVRCTKTLELSSIITKRALKTILRFMYTGEVVTVQNDRVFLIELVQLCHVFKMNSLFSYYLHHLAEFLSATNVQELVALSYQYQDSLDLTTHLTNRLCSLYLRWDFQELEIVDLKTILDHFKRHKASLDEIATTVLYWVADDPLREQYLQELMDYFDLKQLSTKSLVSMVDNWNIIRRNITVLNSLKLEIRTRKKETNTDFIVNTSPEQKLFIFYKEGDTGFVTTYDIHADIWSENSVKLPFELLTDAVVVVCDNHIYFVGGYKLAIQCSDVVYNYCPVQNLLVSTGVLAIPVFSCSVGALCGAIYIVNGMHRRRDAPLGCEVQRYNPYTGACKKMASTLSYHSRSLMYAFNDFLYIAGLYVPERFIEKYDPNFDQWTFITKIDQQLGYYPATFSGTKLLIANKLGKKLNTYDFCSNKWTIHSHVRGPRKLAELWGATKNGKATVLALSNGQAFMTLDAESEVYKAIRSPTMHIPSHFGSVVAMSHGSTFVKPNPSYDLLQALESLWKTTTLTDVTFVCPDKQFKAHELLLRMTSCYFQIMFSSGFCEGRTKTVVLPKVRGQIMEIILSFIYSGTVTVELEFDNLLEILSVAHLMEIRALFNFCLHQLVGKLSLDLFWELFTYMELYDLFGLEARVYYFLANNFDQLVQSGEFLFMTANQLARLLKFPGVQNKMSIKVALEAVIQWTKFDPSRIGNCRELLLSIDHQYITSELLISISDHLDTEHDETVNYHLRKELFKMIQAVHSKHAERMLISFGRPGKRNVQTYNLITKEWSIPVEAPFVPSFGMTAIVFKKSVFFFGGAADLQLQKATTKVFKYFPSTNTAEDIASLKFPVCNSAAAVAYDTIFIVGSKNAEGKSLNKVQHFVPFLGSCREVASTIRCHDNPGAFSSGGYLFVYNAAYYYSNIFERYDLIADQWTMVNSLPGRIPLDRLSITFGQHIYIYLEDDEIEISHSPSQYVDWDVVDTTSEAYRFRVPILFPKLNCIT